MLRLGGSCGCCGTSWARPDVGAREALVSAMEPAERASSVAPYSRGGRRVNGRTLVAVGGPLSADWCRAATIGGCRVATIGGGNREWPTALRPAIRGSTIEWSARGIITPTPNDLALSLYFCAVYHFSSLSL